MNAVVLLVGHDRFQVPGANIERLLRSRTIGDVLVGQLELPATLAWLQLCCANAKYTNNLYRQTVVAVVIDFEVRVDRSTLYGIALEFKAAVLVCVAVGHQVVRVGA